MTDIVDQLRDYTTQPLGQNYEGACILCRKAADEIEKLRSQVDRALDVAADAIELYHGRRP